MVKPFHFEEEQQKNTQQQKIIINFDDFDGMDSIFVWGKALK